MTSGNFVSIPISSITVNRESRQRRELKDVDTLAESIGRLGLINPITITRDGILVAGERRYTAISSLGWTHVSCQYIDDLDPAELHAIELEENIKRLDIDWRDRCRAIEEYHRLRSNEPGWSQESTAAALGITQGNVSQNLSVARELKAANPRVVAAPQFSVALGVTTRKNERAAASAIASFREPPKVPLLNVDFNQWAKTYEGPPFNFLHCDFPYGIGADGFAQGSSAAHGGYDDSEDNYWRLVSSLLDNCDQICSESTHIMFWFSMKYYQPTLDTLSREFRMNPMPLVWVKSDNVGILPDPSRGPRQVYETALIGSRGDRKVVQSVANAFAHPTVRERHMSEKPEPMLSHFFRMFVDENTSLLDPTCGSASAIRAGLSGRAHRVLGLERDPEFFAAARDSLTAR